MRVSKTTQLLNSIVAKNSDGIKKASVTISFTGDANFTIKRSVNSEGKISYRLNDKKTTRQEIIDMLNRNGALVNETNTITQGEIIRILNFNIKERRALLDIASGIKEFDEKRQDSLKELEKVDAKISNVKVLLNERVGFLNELKKEKDDAEAYGKLDVEIKRLSYTILKKRFIEIEKNVSEINNNLDQYKVKIQEINTRLSELDSKTADFNKKHIEISKKLSDKSQEFNRINRIIEDINKDIAVYSAKIEDLQNNLNNILEQVSSYKNEREQSKFTIDNNNKILSTLKDTLKDLLGDYEKYESNNNTNLDSYKAIQASYEQLSTKIDELNTNKTDKLVNLNRLNAENDSIISDINRLKSELDSQTNNLSNFIRDKTELTKRISEEGKNITKLKQDRINIAKSVDELNRKVINLREQLSLYGGATDNLNDVLKKTIKTGFYGRAYELCNYDEKYSDAINAAVGGRLNYFVVENMEVANDAIKILKRNLMGRASFIPLRDLSRTLEIDKKLNPLINYINFDIKYKSAFDYLFSNTYLISDIKEAKNLGLGRHRFVTLDGELVEPSGIVTGGRSKNNVAYPGKLRAILNEEETERIALMNTQKQIDEDINNTFINLSKDQTTLENLINNNGSLEESKKKYNEELDNLNKKLETNKKNSEELRDSIEKLDLMKNKFVSELEILKTKIKEMSNDMNQEEVAKFKELKSKIDNIKVEIASKEKENHMNMERLDKLNLDLDKLNEQIKTLKLQLEDYNLKISKLKGEKEKNENEIKGHNKNSTSYYDELKSIEKSLSDLGFEKGSLSSDLTKYTNEVNNLNSKKVEFDVRLTDIKAELSTYTEKIEEIDGNLDFLTELLSKDKKKLSEFGNVNLKAPDMYKEKSKDVEETADKLNVLESEKASILNMIKEIEVKKLEVFNETFDFVNKNFSMLYKSTFGTNGRLKLDNVKDPFNSGLLIYVEKKSGREESVDSLSGGEKSFTLLILLFSILMHNPMSFYIFDEIDSALDKENSKKLSTLIKKLSEKSQFIVVSHNDTLITSADAVLGFVNQNDESRVVGIELVDFKNKV